MKPKYNQAYYYLDLSKKEPQMAIWKNTGTDETRWENRAVFFDKDEAQNVLIQWRLMRDVFQ